MNREEFVNKLIDFAKEQINYYENKIVEDEKYPSLQKCHKEELISAQEGLNHFLEIKQDLDKLQQLEKKYQKLKETFKKRAELCSEFSEYNRQYEKVLDLLMDKFKLELKGNRLYFLYNNQYFELDKEQEKLMKEAFGYE